MQVMGYVLWAIACLVPACHPGVHLFLHPAWLVAFGVFGAAFHIGASAPSGPQQRTRRLAALAVMTPAMVAMAALMPCAFGALTLVVVASQVALVLSPRAALAWSVAQTLLVSCFLVPDFGWTLGAAQLLALLGFQGFTVAAIASARGESEARLAPTVANDQLRATQALLNEACLAQQRERIARDLHDALGHSLTALGLQLEIASHVDEGAARVQLAKARELTGRLLGEVRDVVGRMRADRPSRLLTAIRALVVEVPGLTLHLDVPESLVVEESAKVDCVVRCVQELVTNARRHAHAQNLWISLRCENGAIAVEAHDDGKGAEALQDGHGLCGMRSRFQEMGGWLEVRTAAERAFSVSARLPLRTASNAVGDAS
jgi:signal transduction histidine kinase